MSEDYRGMWKDLGLDLEGHDALLGVLGGAYQDTFLSQKNRPEGMGYFDFVMSEVHGLRIMDRYYQVDCAIFTPNPQRLEHIQEMAAAYKADGVIHYGLQFCQPYLMESIPVEKALEEKNIPTLCIETDYSMEDVGQLKTRIEAFVEQLR
jgi:benzoyl-CoA reductase/2-hydroxyglutaryl-CoA dehydratase subunit BcrC/BadD/HgdB